MFEKLEKRVMIQGVITFDTSMHIGGNATSSTTKSPILRNSLKIHYIPGSTLKGVFRSTVERISASIGFNTCVVDNEGCISSLKGPNYQKLKKMQEQHESEEKVEKYILDNICDTCKLFGSGFMASKISFFDAIVDQELFYDYSEIRDGVAIDRDSGNAIDGAKYDFEVLPAGVKFPFKIVLENPDNDDMALTSIGLTEFIQGEVYLGAYTSRGLGKFHLTINQISEIDFSNNSHVKQYLLEKTYPNIFDSKEKIEEYLKHPIEIFLEENK